jgi:hypothetical protein
MGRDTRYRSLPDQAYDPRVTSLEFPLRPPVPKNADGTLDNFRNRNLRNTTPIQLVGGAASVRVLPANPRRTGLIIQNKDTAATLFVGYGIQADLNAFQIPPGGSILEDFTCPAGEVYLFSTANIQAVLIDTTRGF